MVALPQMVSTIAVTVSGRLMMVISSLGAIDINPATEGIESLYVLNSVIDNIFGCNRPLSSNFLQIRMIFLHRFIYQR